MPVSDDDTREAEVSDLGLLTKGGSVAARLFRWDEAPEDVAEVKLRLDFADRVLEARAKEGYFQALRELRRLLEADGLLLVCNGTSLDVYPSPMTESMGYAEKAYRHTLGRAAGNADLVNIFDVGPDLRPSTLGEQREFHQKWLGSLR